MEHIRVKTPTAYKQLKKRFTNESESIGEFVIKKYSRTFIIYHTTLNGQVFWPVLNVTPTYVRSMLNANENTLPEAIRLFSIPLK